MYDIPAKKVSHQDNIISGGHTYDWTVYIPGILISVSSFTHYVLTVSSLHKYVVQGQRYYSFAWNTAQNA